VTAMPSVCCNPSRSNHSCTRLAVRCSLNPSSGWAKIWRASASSSEACASIVWLTWDFISAGVTFFTLTWTASRAGRAAEQKTRQDARQAEQLTDEEQRGDAEARQAAGDARHKGANGDQDVGGDTAGQRASAPEAQ